MHSEAPTRSRVQMLGASGPVPVNGGSLPATPVRSAPGYPAAGKPESALSAHAREARRRRPPRTSGGLATSRNRKLGTARAGGTSRSPRAAALRPLSTPPGWPRPAASHGRSGQVTVRTTAAAGWRQASLALRQAPGGSRQPPTEAFEPAKTSLRPPRTRSLRLSGPGLTRSRAHPVALSDSDSESVAEATVGPP
jgi:hypothetical protein